MRPRIALLILFLVLMIWQPHLSLGNPKDPTTEVSLYAHTDPSATSVNGRVLTLVANTTSRQAADVRNGLNFTLVPPLSAPLRVLGRVDAIVWLQAQQSVRGTLEVTISELTANASTIEMTYGSVTVGISSLPYQVQFGLGRVNHTLPAGSSLRFGVQFSPVRTVPVMLLWDDPFAATRLVLRVESVPKIVFGIADASGKTSAIFPGNGTNPVQLFAELIVEDPFHGINIRNVSLTVTNSSGGSFISDVPMNLTSRVESPLRLNYTLPMAIPPGRFNVTVSVLDVTGRSFFARKGVLITAFHTLVVVLVDSQKRPAPDLNVSLYADDQLIGQVMTNSSGIGVVRVPSSHIVGPLILEVRHNLTLVLTDQIESESDSALHLVLPLYDWNIAVSFETLSLPVSDALVGLYLNGTLIASSVTDANGIAHFLSVPLGTYEVTVASRFASGRFQNVTHVPESMNIMLKVSLVPGIRESTLLIMAALAVFVVFGAIAVRRERARTRRFNHVAELLGGRILESTVVMIVGPSGAGKSLLLNNILADSLELGRPCLHITNSELPSKIKEQLSRLGVNVRASENESKLRFIDAYSSQAGAVSAEKHSIASLGDLTALGIEITRCTDELGTWADVFLDSITPVISSGDPRRALDFIRHYGARTTKSGGNFVYVATTTLEPALLGRFEEASDCVLQVEKALGAGKIMGRLLVKKARGLEHERDWVGFKITSKGRIEFVSLPAAKR